MQAWCPPHVMQQPPFRAFEFLLRALNSRVAAKAVASEIPQSTMIRTIIFETYRPAARSIERINPSQRVASLIVTRALTPGFPNRNTASAFCRRIVFSQSFPCRAAGAIVWARLRSTDEVVNADDFSAALLAGIAFARRNRIGTVLANVIEVDVTRIRIKGSKDVLERAVLAGRNGTIPGSQMSMGWRSLAESNRSLHRERVAS